MIHMLYQTSCIILMRWIKRRLSCNLWINVMIHQLQINLLSYVSLFHCAGYDVFFLLDPSTRLMSFHCKMNSLWVIVTVTTPCTSLRTTTIKPHGIRYGRRQMKNFTPCSTMTMTLLTLPARCFSCGRRTIGWWLGGGTLINITRW